jgi:hypothetical protein
MERETGIEPATNSLEGCDSTTELLPLEGALCAILAQPERAAEPGRQPSHATPAIGRNGLRWRMGFGRAGGAGPTAAA